MKPIIGMVLGDATGIGPELIARLCARKENLKNCRPIIIGDLRVLRQGMDIAKVRFPVRAIEAVEDAAYGDAIDVWDQHVLDPSEYTLGELNIKSGGVTMQLQLLGVDLCVAQKINGLVYAPYNKEAMKKAGYNFSDSIALTRDHLKFADFCGEINIIDGLWTTRVTSHIPLSEVSRSITEERVLESIRFADRSIRKTGMENPRIAVAGLNPHNGENGLCGDDEMRSIRPAVEQAKAEGINAAGPFPADTVFVNAFKGRFDLVVTMYHDQGQIAMKLKDFGNIVTHPAGFPFPLATPAHGTAFDIAGKGIANVNPTLRALELVCKIASHSQLAPV